ncbi:MAG: response regulator, partial [Pirellulales bacterium]|nr:response regulator [Pirellulales bacterium]
MSDAATSFHILMADDDPDDCLLLKEALTASGLPHHLHTFPDGEALLAHLDRLTGAGTSAAPRPDLILLDLNMPRKDGRETLRLLKRDRHWQRIPIVVLTTSIAESDISLAYETGASSYIAKPATFQGWIELATALSGYWFQL